MSHNVNQIISSLNNALKKKSSICVLPKNNISIGIIKVLYNSGYVAFYTATYNKGKPLLVLFFKFSLSMTPLNGIKSVSSQGKRVYWTHSELKKNISLSNWFYVLSTNNGIISSTEALKLKIGGEVLLRSC